MSIITLLLSIFIGISIYLGINYIFIYYRLRWDRKHLFFSIMSFAAAVYILCTLLEYMTSSTEVYFTYLKVQVISVPFFFVSLLWFVALYTEQGIWKFKILVSISFSIFIIFRFFHPAALTISGVQGMKPWQLPWNEIIWLLDSTSSIWSLVYYIFLVFIYSAVIYCLIRQYRGGEKKKALMLLLAVLLLFFGNLNDIIIITLQTRWIFLTEFSFVGFMSVMSIQLSGEIIRLADVEKKLEDVEIQRRAIFNSMYEFAGLLDIEGRILDANESAMKFAGVDIDLMKGEYFWMAPWWEGGNSENERLKEAIKKASRGEFIRFETVHKGGDGRMYNVDFSLTPVWDEKGRVRYLVPEGRDISELREAENTIMQKNLELTALNEELNATIEEMEATNEEFEMQNEELVKSRTELMQRTEEYRNLFEFAGDAILVIKSGRIIDCNTRALEYFGYSSDELTGREAAILSPDTQPDGKGSQEHEIKKINGALEGSFQQYEWLYQRKDGTFLYAEVSLKSIEFYSGVHLLAIIRDISDRKAAEEEKRRIQSQLAQAQKMEAIGTLAGGLAHDFNNVLGGVMGSINMLQIILEKEKLVRRGDVEKYLEMGMEASRRSADIVGQILAFSRREDLQLVPTDINFSLRHVQKICTNSFPKSVELNFMENDSPVMVSGDPMQIEQVILNLAVNASHAMTLMKKDDMTQGGRLTVRTEIKRESPYSVPGLEREGIYVVIRVEDQGVGISKAELERIFDPFYTTKDKNAGTGLGLAISYSIVKQHGGIILAESTPGKGSVFSVYMPLLEEYETVRREGPENICLTKGEGHVLVIDDEEPLLRLAKAILGECGYRVTTAARPEKGIGFYKREYKDVDVILLDLSMPGMSGFEVFAALKEINPEVKCILVSGKLEEETVQRAGDAGIADTIRKPYMLNVLSEKIKKVLSDGG